MNIDKLNAYELIKKHRIEELQTDGYILKHKKTGARVVLMENNDDNKVFYIGFRTPPKESTGVMHILEHSVLCGSKNFPVKDPFIELAKGSLNTFLNAMTYPDKTVYPVASCNDKDFQNLMHVYLDAVFYPNILNSDKTFRQEGWHYELEDEDAELKLNGVVYSEMKGAFSSPDDVFERAVFNSLFPDTTYGEESGGDPKVIPELTYEHYIEVYKQYYHPSNAYIYLYGDMDMEEKLEFIDREYLSDFDAIDIDSSIPKQEAFGDAVNVVKEYSITESEPLKENAYLSYNVAMDNNLNREEYIAWQVIDYALCTSQGAVLKQALIDAGLGKDVYSQYDNGVKQPYFSIVAKGADENRKDEFIALIDEVLSGVVKNGLDKNALKAGLNGLEFRYREADFGSYPPGLMYGLQILDSWLYDDMKPFIHIEADATYKSLREKIDGDYYEQLIAKGIIENSHKSYVTVVPSIGLTDREEKELKDKLADLKASMSADEISKLIADSRELVAYQEAEDDAESLKCIPVLEISDIKKDAAKLVYEVRDIAGRKSIYHNIHTNGIDYVRVMFDATKIPARLFPYLPMLKGIIGLVATANYSYQELFNKIFMETGGISNAINMYENHNNPDDYKITFEWKGKCLSGDIKKVFELITEMILNSDFTDLKRHLEILDELKSQTQESMLRAGHTVAVHRAMSYVTRGAAFADVISGMEAYRILEKHVADYDSYKQSLSDNLIELTGILFSSDNVMFDFTGTEEEYKVFKAECEALIEKLPGVKYTEEAFVPEVTKKNEGFTSASQVQYVCRAGNFKDKGLDYTGALRVLKVIMGYDYLWNNIRVKGGAYGCMSGFGKSGESYFVSYRDPNLSKTIDVYKGVISYLNDFDVDTRAMTQYIIGAVSEIDTPLTPANKALRALSAYMCNITDDVYQKERDELLATDVKTIKSLAPYIEAMLSDECLCVVGNEAAIEGEKEIFDSVRPLFNA